MASEIRVNTINNSSGLGTISISNSGQVISGITTVASLYSNTINDGPLSGSRNMIINGAMAVNQRRYTGAAGTTLTASFGPDRWVNVFSHDGAISVGQTVMNSTVGGDAYADGFQEAFILRMTTGDGTMAAAQYQIVQQYIEGYNLQGIKKGTANAKPTTLSFWVRSSTTGTYIFDLIDEDNSRHISRSYTINSANTWEKKILTFPADTTGVVPSDETLGFRMSWWLAAGSNFSSGTLNTSWAALTATDRAVGQVNGIATTGNSFMLTGVQYEVGTNASEFERRSYNHELNLCQRYFQRCHSDTYLFANNATATIYHGLSWLSMRATPTVRRESQTAYSNTSAVSIVPRDENGGRYAITVAVAGYAGAAITFTLDAEVPS